MAQSTIEWTDETWNPVTGCTKYSPGCANCYAARMARRLQLMGQAKYRNGFEVTCHPDALEAPKRWRKPRRVFVNSMSDLFHEAIPFSYIERVFAAMRDAPKHTFQVLTKRADRLAQLSRDIDWPANVWMGVSVENDRYTTRIDKLHSTQAAIKFLSLEPLLGPLPNLNLAGIHWVIVGGESGPGVRLMDKPWVVDILHQCQVAHVPFFFKQWGGTNKKRSGRLLLGALGPNPINYTSVMRIKNSPIRPDLRGTNT